MKRGPSATNAPSRAATAPDTVPTSTSSTETKHRQPLPARGSPRRRKQRRERPRRDGHLQPSSLHRQRTAAGGTMVPGKSPSSPLSPRALPHLPLQPSPPRILRTTRWPSRQPHPLCPYINEQAISSHGTLSWCRPSGENTRDISNIFCPC